MLLELRSSGGATWRLGKAHQVVGIQCSTLYCYDPALLRGSCARRNISATPCGTQGSVHTDVAPCHANAKLSWCEGQSRMRSAMPRWGQACGADAGDVFGACSSAGTLVAARLESSTRSSEDPASLSQLSGRSTSHVARLESCHDWYRCIITRHRASPRSYSA